MSTRLTALLGTVVCLALTGCASPYFVHDPQIGFVSPGQIPWLLKSLRCELATYIAENNQREIVHIGLLKFLQDPNRAIESYPFFGLDPSRFGGVVLDLKIQDTIGTQSGSNFGWKRTASDNIHLQAWNISPTLGDQSSYEANIPFDMPQDIYKLYSSTGFQESVNISTEAKAGNPYLCYKHIPKLRSDQVPFNFPTYVLDVPPLVSGESYKNPPNGPPVLPATVKIADLQQDLAGLAAGNYPEEEEFTRIKVNGTTPLAKWLQDVSTTISSSSLVRSLEEQQESMSSGQMTYTFTIQVTAGVDVKSVATTTLWSIGLEGAANIQHTSTLTLVLNGVESANAAGAKTGSSVRTVSQTGTTPPKTVLSYTPLPEISLAPKPKKPQKSHLFAAPVRKKLAPVRKPSVFIPDYAQRNKEKGSLIYPLVPLSPLGSPGP